MPSVPPVPTVEALPAPFLGGALVDVALVVGVEVVEVECAPTVSPDLVVV